jgi:hypothetical protein
MQAMCFLMNLAQYVGRGRLYRRTLAHLRYAGWHADAMCVRVCGLQSPTIQAEIILNIIVSNCTSSTSLPLHKFTGLHSCGGHGHVIVLS